MTALTFYAVTGIRWFSTRLICQYTYEPICLVRSMYVLARRGGLEGWKPSLDSCHACPSPTVDIGRQAALSPHSSCPERAVVGRCPRTQQALFVYRRVQAASPEMRLLTDS